VRRLSDPRSPSMETLSPYRVVSNADGTFVVANNETGQILSTHLRLQKAALSAERLNRKAGVLLQRRGERPTSR